MDIHLKLGTLPMKTYETREYKSIVVGDKIEVLVGGIGGKWQLVKIDLIHDMIPMRYFGGYV